MKPTVALVLGSGGARGIAHIGVIRELIKEGYVITSISGTSMGALIGGVYAAGKLDEYESWLCSQSKRDILSLVDFALSRQGIVKADKVLNEMQKFIPDQKIENLPIKYSAVTTDLKNKKEVVITEGSLYEAIRASISIPVVFTPIQKVDALFVDGGVLNPVPVNRVYRHENDILIAVNVNAQIPYLKSSDDKLDQSIQKYPNKGKQESYKRKLARLSVFGGRKNNNSVNLIGDSVGLMLSQISKLTLELNPPDLLIEISRHSCGIFDFHKAAELIELGKAATKESYNKLE